MMPPTIYVTADLHLGHRNIIDYADRPYRGIDDMHHDLMERWRARVRQQDTVYILGDVALWEPPLLAQYLVRLPGRKIYIEGNHDRNLRYMAHRLGLGIHKTATIEYRGVGIRMQHRPPKPNTIEQGIGLVLHGHTHSRAGARRGTVVAMDGRHIETVDCGVDAWHYRPVALREIEEITRCKSTH